MGKAESHHHNVYVILLDDAVAKHPSVLRMNPNRDPAKPCVYVGMSGLPAGTPCYALVWEGSIGAFYEIDDRLNITLLADVMNEPAAHPANTPIGRANRRHRPNDRIVRIDNRIQQIMSLRQFIPVPGHRLGDAFHSLLSQCRSVRGFGDFWSHMLTAEGVIDVGIEVGIHPWDVAAVQVIVEEAGGRFSDFDGERRIDSRSVITSNGLLHQRVVDLMRPA